MGATLAAGGTWVMQEMFDAGQALSLIERERVTEPHVFAHQAGRSKSTLHWASTDLSSCTKVYGKSVFTRHPDRHRRPELEHARRLRPVRDLVVPDRLPAATPRVTCCGTAATAVSCPATSSGSSIPKPGRVLGANEEGELVVRGPTLMEHYVKRTRGECFDADGFYRTGDFGSFDDDGFVYFGGRRTEMIKTGGANVSPAEIEVQLHASRAREARPGRRRPRRPSETRSWCSASS